MSSAFPRLLVATEFPPNASGGGPAVVRQMLQGWPAASLFWWSVKPDRRTGLEPAAHFIAAIPPKFYPQATLPRLKASLLAGVWVPFASAHLRRTVRKVRPDAIWAIPHLWSIPPLGEVLPGSACSYHVSLHDFPDAHHLERRIGDGLTKQFVAATDRLYRKAQSRDAISDEMAADLKERTGAAADQIVHAGLERADFAYLISKVSEPREKIRIAYAGTVVAEEAFALFVESLNRVRKRLPRSVEMHFFGAHSYRAARWFDKNWMIEHGDLGVAELNDSLRKLDWGFAPMELTDRNPRYNRFSLPTKVVSYLAAGLGVISLAHEAATISRLAHRYDLGLRLTETDIGGIDAILSDGLAIPKVWERYGSAIMHCAKIEFDAEIMRRNLWSRLGSR